MEYIFKEGEAEDLSITIDVQYINKRYNIQFHIKLGESIDCLKTVNLKESEMIDLLETLTRFKDREISDLFIWDLNTSAFELILNPDVDAIEFKLYLDPPFFHLSGLFFQMTGISKYGPFIDFLNGAFRSNKIQ